MSPALSVIIPIYKVEETLDRCIESVVSQDVNEGIEIILVDDGSPDKCPAKCDEWARRHSRIRVIHKTNGGLSDARNAGLDAAQGQWVTFIDSDDYIADGTYHALMAYLREHNGIDILEYPVSRFHGSARQSLLFFKDKIYNDASDYWFSCSAYAHSYAWNKIYRRALFGKVRFPKGKVFEDVSTLWHLLDQQPTVATTSRGMYYYTANASGITATAGTAELKSLLDDHITIIQRYINDGKDTTDAAFQSYYLHVLNIQLTVPSSPVLPFIRIRAVTGLPLKTRIKAAMLNLLGIKRLCKIFKVMIYRS